MNACEVCGQLGSHVCEDGSFKLFERDGPARGAMQFSLRQRVRIKEIDRTGIVTAAMIDGDGWSYRVVYWDNSQRKSEWLFDFEIEAKP